MLSHVGDDDRLPPSDFPKLPDHVLPHQGVPQVSVENVPFPTFFLPLIYLTQPIFVVPLLHMRDDLREHSFQIADDANVYLDDLVQLRGVYLNVNLAGVWGESVNVAGDAVVESHPESQEQVSLLDCVVHASLAVHPHHSQEERVIARNPTDAQQRDRYRRLGLLGEFQHLPHGPRFDHPLACQDKGAFGIVDQLHGILQVLRH